VPLAGVAIEIASKAVAGKNHFDIRLDPPELGRIEVRLDVGRDGSISSHVIADRKDTLDLLQRDASGLQRAFEDAGLKTSDQGMQFSLRDHSAGQQQPMPNATTAQLVVEDETPIETLPVTYSRLAGSGGGLDIRV
jgi:flagellar hook-length control protein FliK